jgi:hypothetical protein
MIIVTNFTSSLNKGGIKGGLKVVGITMVIPQGYYF